jgi:hypothetical protein
MSTEHVCRPPGYLRSSTHIHIICPQACHSRGQRCTALLCLEAALWVARTVICTQTCFLPSERNNGVFLVFNLLDTRNSQNIIFTGIRFCEHVKNEKRKAQCVGLLHHTNALHTLPAHQERGLDCATIKSVQPHTDDQEPLRQHRRPLLHSCTWYRKNAGISASHSVELAALV